MKEILIVDIETTNFLSNGGKIVEIGMVSLNLGTGKRRLLFDEMVYEEGITREECEKSWIVANTTMTVEDIRNGHRLDKIEKIVQNIINAYPDGATAFNRPFDVDFLESRGFVFPKLLPCLMLSCTPVLQIPPTPKMKKWKPKIKYKNPNAEEAYNYFFPADEYTELHRGGDDAMHEALIALKLYEMGNYQID